MTYVALALAAALVVVTLAFLNLLRSQQRAHSRREDLLVNQILNAAGTPWQPAPAEEDRRERRAAAVREVGDAVPARFTASPEQFPDTYPE